MKTDAPVIEAIWCSTTPVRRQCPVSGWREEVLDLAGCDLTALQSGVSPLVAAHRCLPLDAHLGIVESAWIDHELGEGRALVRLSRRAEVRPIVRAILRGDLRAVSCAYSVARAEPVPDAALPTYRVTRWCPQEISIVSTPADSRCRVIRP